MDTRKQKTDNLFFDNLLFRRVEIERAEEDENKGRGEAGTRRGRIKWPDRQQRTLSFRTYILRKGND